MLSLISARQFKLKSHRLERKVRQAQSKVCVRVGYLVCGLPVHSVARSGFSCLARSQSHSRVARPDATMVRAKPRAVARLTSKGSARIELSLQCVHRLLAVSRGDAGRGQAPRNAIADPKLDKAPSASSLGPACAARRATPKRAPIECVFRRQTALSGFAFA